jgi:hypothetical protein
MPCFLIYMVTVVCLFSDSVILLVSTMIHDDGSDTGICF